MLQDKRKVIDPVCRMSVNPQQNAIVYQQMHFAFCSEQCKQRFLANPHLYVGYPGHKAAVQEGRKVRKHRKLKLDTSLPEEKAVQLIEQVQTMMGIISIKAEADRIDIVYDLLQVTAAQVEDEIGKAGVALGEGWSARLRRAFVDFLEETEIESIEGQSMPGGHHH